MSKISPTTNAVIATVTVGSNLVRVEFAGTSIWVSNFGNGNLGNGWVSKISF